MEISLCKPDITQREIDAVVDVMKSGILSIGPKIEEFERKVADYVGVKHAIAVNSGTSGLHLLIKALGIKKGDEVITTPFSFVATANCILFEGARPVFADIDINTLELDMNGIEEKITPRTKAVIPVDIFGHPYDIKSLRKITDKYGLKIIQDACEALGSEYDGDKTGLLADGAVFAFYPNKQITTGEGGMIVTNNSEVAELCRSYRSQGRARTGLWLHHERLGYNYRMSELNAVVGSVQMDRLNEIISKRCSVAERYNKGLSNIKGLSIPYVSPKTTIMSWFSYVVRFDENINRDMVMDYLRSKGIGCKPYFTPIHLQPYMIEEFKYKQGDFPNAEKAGRSCLALPFYNNMSQNEIDYVVENIKEAIIQQVGVI